MAEEYKCDNCKDTGTIYARDAGKFCRPVVCACQLQKIQDRITALENKSAPRDPMSIRYAR